MVGTKDQNGSKYQVFNKGQNGSKNQFWTKDQTGTKDKVWTKDQVGTKTTKFEPRFQIWRHQRFFCYFLNFFSLIFLTKLKHGASHGASPIVTCLQYFYSLIHLDSVLSHFLYGDNFFKQSQIAIAPLERIVLFKRWLAINFCAFMMLTNNNTLNQTIIMCKSELGLEIRRWWKFRCVGNSLECSSQCIKCLLACKTDRALTWWNWCELTDAVEKCQDVPKVLLKKCWQIE